MGSSEYPATSAPSISSHLHSHDPLKPVWPVTRTLLPFYTELNNFKSP
jgi:hypothetical protein